MNSFVQHKPFNNKVFLQYLQPAIDSNQFTNYGKAVQLLEQRARVMLKIADNKAVIAVNNGASAIHAILHSINRYFKETLSIGSQDFTFPCNFQGPAETARALDISDTEQVLINKNDKIVIVTNCFGHLQNLHNIIQEAQTNNQIVIFDNAATPYSFINGINACNIGTASYVSLHHTKPIGFGEGGLVIIDKEYELYVRSAYNFGIMNGVPSSFGSNYKMSDIAAASILQWWDSFNIDELANKYRTTYMQKMCKYVNEDIRTLTNTSDDNFFPNCLPLIHKHQINITDYPDEDARKYYKPFRGTKNSVDLFNRIVCLPITELVND